LADLSQALVHLLTASHEATPEDLPALASQVAKLLDADDMIVHLVDYTQTDLVPLTAVDAPSADTIPVEGTLAGRAFTHTEIHEAGGERELRFWVPLLDGAERLGVLEIRTSAAPSAQVRQDYRHVAALLAELLVTRRAYGDAIERTRRRLPMQLAAEILWNLLPPLTYVRRDVAVAAILEPAYDVGGDAFDYAVNGHILHAAIFDAVGHGITASDVTSLAINAYRNARRSGLDLVDTYRSIDKWISARHPDSWVTAVLLELDTATGIARKISAGHPGELLLRDGHLVKALTAPTAMPLGLAAFGDVLPGVEEEALQPGDQILLYSDGVVEARTQDGEFFGRDRLVDYLTRALAGQLTPPETMRRLIHAILAHQHDRLQDDATAVLIQWQPDPAPTNDALA
jgi:sigma-B regulation protein RsbU (phosphoserine phosphatase)